MGLLFLCWFSSFEGSKNYLHFGVDMGAAAVFSLIIYYFALSRRLTTEQVRERMESSAGELEGADGEAGGAPV
jgi:hypothetical protein